MELTGCPETSVMNYDYMLRKSPEESSFHLKLGLYFHSLFLTLFYRFTVR
jgi:hypothetical protein